MLITHARNAFYWKKKHDASSRCIKQFSDFKTWRQNIFSDFKVWFFFWNHSNIKIRICPIFSGFRIRILEIFLSFKIRNFLNFRVCVCIQPCRETFLEGGGVVWYKGGDDVEFGGGPAVIEWLVVVHMMGVVIVEVDWYGFQHGVHNCSFRIVPWICWTWTPWCGGLVVVLHGFAELHGAAVMMVGCCFSYR